MRALFTCETSLDVEDLKNLLEQEAWTPDPNLGDEFFEKKMKNLMNLVHPARKDEVKNGHILITSHNFTNTWGFVTRTVLRTYTFRLFNPSLDELKIACEDLVNRLYRKKYIKNKNPNIANFSVVEVQEEDSDNKFYGKIRGRPVISALRERKIEIYLSAVSFIVMAAMAYFSSPLRPSFSSLPEWDLYFAEGMGRIASAAFFSFMIFFLRIYIHVIDARRKTCVDWDIMRYQSPHEKNSSSNEDKDS